MTTTAQMTYTEYLDHCDQLAAEKGGAFAASHDRNDHETNYDCWMMEIEDAIDDDEPVSDENRVAFEAWEKDRQPAIDRARKIAAAYDAELKEHGPRSSFNRGVAF